MIEFTKTHGRLELIYKAEARRGKWVERELDRSGEVRIARTFNFSKDDLIRKADETGDRSEFGELEEPERLLYFRSWHLRGRLFQNCR